MIKIHFIMMHSDVFMNWWNMKEHKYLNYYAKTFLVKSLYSRVHHPPPFMYFVDVYLGFSNLFLAHGDVCFSQLVEHVGI